MPAAIGMVNHTINEYLNTCSAKFSQITDIRLRGLVQVSPETSSLATERG
jgi:hypothetical protein